MGASFKRISIFFILIIIIFIFFSIDLFGQEADSIYVETITISVDSQELLNLEQEISEIPIDYDFISLSENFITSYEQLSLNVIQFKYDLNYYFFNISYSTILGYKTLFYFSSNYGSTFFQGFSFYEVFPFLPFLGFHFFNNNFEMYRKFINWSIEYSFSFKNYNLPKTEYFEGFSSIYSEQKVSGKNNNLDFSLILKTLSFNPSYKFFLFEEFQFFYVYYFNENIYSKIGFSQVFQEELNLKPQLSIDYDFPTIKFLLSIAYDIFLNSFYGKIKFSFDNEDIKVNIILEKNYEYQLINNLYTIASLEDNTFYQDYYKAFAFIKFNFNNLFFDINAEYKWFNKNNLILYNEQQHIFNIINTTNTWQISTYFDFYWQINQYFSTSASLNLNLPSYFLKNEPIVQNICDTLFDIDLSFNLFLTEIASIKFTLHSEIIRLLLGINNPIYNLNIAYNLDKNDYEVLFSISLNIISYYIIPYIKSPVIILTFSSKFYF